MLCLIPITRWGWKSNIFKYSKQQTSAIISLWLTLLPVGASGSGSVRSGGLWCGTLHSVPGLVLTKALFYAVKQPVQRHAIHIPLPCTLVLLTCKKIQILTMILLAIMVAHQKTIAKMTRNKMWFHLLNLVFQFGKKLFCWNCRWLTCWLTNDEVCTLVHFELTSVVGSMLITESLHLFTFCAGEACHTNSAATQHRAQIVLNW